MENGAISEMSVSARMIYLVLQDRKIARLCELMDITGLSKRTVLYSVKKLKESNLIDVLICLNDTRGRFYCIKLKDQ